MRPTGPKSAEFGGIRAEHAHVRVGALRVTASGDAICASSKLLRPTKFDQNYVEFGQFSD